jgi:signal transduction histidine kinase
MGDISLAVSNENIYDIIGFFRHEINNPLGVAMCYSTREELNPKASELIYVEEMSGEVEKINSIVKRLRGFEKRDVNFNILYELLLKMKAKEIIKHSDRIKELCDEGKFSIESTKKIDSIKRASERMKSVAGLASMGRLKDNRIKETSTYIDIKEATREIIEFYSNEPIIKDAGIGIRLQYDEFPKVYTNKYMIETILNVLLSNSFQNAPNYTNIEVGLKNQGNNLEMIVENFTNGNPARKSFGLGRGLGLEFLKKIVKEGMNGAYSQTDKTQLPVYENTKIFGIDNKDNLKNKTGVYSSKITLPNNLQ